MEPKKTEEFVLLANGKRVAVSKESAGAVSDDSEAPVIERVHNVWGSSSGARSDFFDIYCKNRNMEHERLEVMEKQWKEDMENKVFQTIRYNRMMKEKEKQEKRREKRAKRKMKHKSAGGRPTEEAESEPGCTESDLGSTKKRVLYSGNHIKRPADAPGAEEIGGDNNPDSCPEDPKKDSLPGPSKLVIDDDLL